MKTNLNSRATALESVFFLAVQKIDSVCMNYCMTFVRYLEDCLLPMSTEMHACSCCIKDVFQKGKGSNVTESWLQSIPILNLCVVWSFEEFLEQALG